MNISDYFFTTKQASEILGINRITIWRWMKQGKIETQQVGREILIPKWQIELLKQEDSETAGRAT